MDCFRDMLTRASSVQSVMGCIIIFGMIVLARVLWKIDHWRGWCGRGAGYWLCRQCKENFQVSVIVIFYVYVTVIFYVYVTVIFYVYVTVIFYVYATVIFYVYVTVIFYVYVTVIFYVYVTVIFYVYVTVIFYVYVIFIFFMSTDVYLTFPVVDRWILCVYNNSSCFIRFLDCRMLLVAWTLSSLLKELFPRICSTQTWVLFCYKIISFLFN